MQGSRAHLEGSVYGSGGADGGLQVAGVAHHVGIRKIETDLYTNTPFQHISNTGYTSKRRLNETSNYLTAEIIRHHAILFNNPFACCTVERTKPYFLCADLVVLAALEGRHPRLSDLHRLHLRLLVERDVAVRLNLGGAADAPHYRHQLLIQRVVLTKFRGFFCRIRTTRLFRITL